MPSNALVRPCSALKLAIVMTGGLILSALGGCVPPHQTAEFGVLTVDATNGEPVDGVRIFRHVDKPGVINAPPDAVATTDETGAAVFDVPRLDSRWLVLRDGYEPMLVDLREGEESREPGRYEHVAHWSEIVESGVMALELVPTSWKPVRLSVLDAETGAGLQGATVSVKSISFFERELDRDLFGVPVMVTQETDGLGIASLNLPSGMCSTVTIEARGHEASTVVFDTSSADGVPSRHRVLMQPHLFEPRRVLVLDRSTGLPVPGVVIRVFLADATDGSTRRESIWTTGEDGTAVVMMPSSGLGSMAIECPNRLPSEFKVVETLSRRSRSASTTSTEVRAGGGDSSPPRGAGRDRRGCRSAWCRCRRGRAVPARP